MKCDYFGHFVVILIVQLFYIKVIKSFAEDDSWSDTDIWGRNQISILPTNNECCKCSEDSNNHEQPVTLEDQTTADEMASLIYFKKFIAILFNRKYFKYDATLDLYERSMLFIVQSSQLDKLEQLQDPRDLDYMLEEIFNNVRDDHKQLHATEASSVFKITIVEVLHYMWQLTKTSEIQFLLVVLLVILLAWIINKRYRIGWFCLIFGSLFIYGYLYTYLECNRELEIKQMLEVLNRDQSGNKMATESKFVKYLKSIFSSDDASHLQQQKLRQSSKLSFRFCRPDHVLIMYFNDIFMKYLEVLLEQCTLTLTIFNGSLGFPYNILSGFLLVFIIVYILKLTFKHILSPSAWFMHRKHLYQSETKEAVKNRSNSNDCLSGDNLRLVLSAITTAPKHISNDCKQPLPINNVSGVEEIKDAIKSSSKTNSPLLKKSVKYKKQHGKNATETSLNDTTNVSLEDLGDDL